MATPYQTTLMCSFNYRHNYQNNLLYSFPKRLNKAQFHIALFRAESSPSIRNEGESPSLANLSEFTVITTCIDYEELDSYASNTSAFPVNLHGLCMS